MSDNCWKVFCDSISNTLLFLVSFARLIIFNAGLSSHSKFFLKILGSYTECIYVKYWVKWLPTIFSGQVSLYPAWHSSFPTQLEIIYLITLTWTLHLLASHKRILFFREFIDFLSINFLAFFFVCVCVCIKLLVISYTLSPQYSNFAVCCLQSTMLVWRIRFLTEWLTFLQRCEWILISLTACMFVCTNESVCLCVHVFL